MKLISSLQYWAKNKLEMFLKQYTSIWPTFILIVLGIKRNKRKNIFHYVAMPMMTSQILKSMDFTKTQKSRYFENETEFFPNLPFWILMSLPKNNTDLLEVFVIFYWRIHFFYFSVSPNKKYAIYIHFLFFKKSILHNLHDNFITWIIWCLLVYSL